MGRSCVLIGTFDSALTKRGFIFVTIFCELSAMSFSQLILVLRARTRLILSTMVLCVLLAVLASLVLSPTYTATASLVLNYTGIDPVTGVAYPGQMVPSYVKTQVDIIKSPSTALKVVRNLGLATDPELQKKFQKATEGRGQIDNWVAEGLLKKLNVIPNRDSNVVEVAFKAKSAEEAARLANAFANAYQATTVQLKATPSRSASSYLNEQLKTLKENLTAAQQRMTEFEQKKGLSSSDSRYDVESMRLAELSAQLVQVQGQLVDAQSRQSNARRGQSESPDVLASPLIQTLRSQLAQAEASFARLSERFTPDHPAWQQGKAEVDRLKSELAGNEQAATGGVRNQAAILRQREAELRVAVETQKAKVMDLNQARNDLALLAREVTTAQESYDAAYRRVNQTSLEGRFNQSDAVVLTAAVPPFEPSFPRLPLNTAAGLLLGIIVGVGVGLLAEARDRRIRSVVDASDALAWPVLATLTATGQQPRRGLFGRSAPRLLTYQ